MNAHDGLPTVPAGAVWRRVDLHLHTPGVHSFRPPSGTDPSTEAGLAELADRYVDRLVDARIDVAAITDYQGVRVNWFEAIRQRAEARGITVLPGAEMSVGQGGGRGLHLLLVCSSGTPPEKINDAIRHADRDGAVLFSARKPHTDITLRDSLEDVLAALRRTLDCVVIAPHAADKNGLIKEWSPKHAAELIAAGLVDAIDLCETAPLTLQGTGVLNDERLAALACTQSSDPKTLDEVGAKVLPDGRARATWLKLSTVNSAALRLALHDPQTRMLTRPPTAPAHARVLSMEVDGSGFLGDLVLRWNDDLNTLIGGRGAGKSAILETLRYALGAEPFSDNSERQSLVKHALGSGGRVRIIVERPGPQAGQRYEIARVLDQQPRVTEVGSGAHLEVPPMEVFGAGGTPMILLQREIQAVSRDDAFRLRLLNEIIGDDARRADAQIRRTTEELRTNARRMAEADERLAKREDYQEQLARLEAEISFYEAQGVADKLARHSRLGADGTILEKSVGQVSEAAAEHEESARATADLLAQVVAGLRSGSSEHTQELVAAATRVESARERVASLLTEVSTELAGLMTYLETARSRWSALVQPLEAELRRLQSELQTDQLDPARFIRASQDLAALRPLVAGLVKHEKARERLLTERSELLRRLQDERRAANRMRRTAAAEVNEQLNKTLVLEVGYLADTDEFRNQLGAILRGSKASNDALDQISATAGVDGVELAAAAIDGETAVSEKYGITAANAQRIVAWLRAEPARLRDLEVLAPRDRVDISLDVEGSPRPLGRLSSGQRATALLLLLFAQRGRPLILDQPEDDLDNRFVYEDVVSLLRREKGVGDAARRRQIIVATHNANIPVNGDAELVVSLSGEGGRCTVRARASIDDAEVRDEIRSVLEGGAEAFRRRAEKYGGLDDT